NLAWKTFDQNLQELPQVLANLLRDGSDRWALYGAIGIAALATVLGLLQLRSPEVARTEGPVERFRMLGLGLIALAMFFLLPFDIRGYVYYLNTRSAHLAAPLILAALPPISPRFQRIALLASAALAVVLALPLARGFKAFDVEASALDRLSQQTRPGPMVM